MLALKDDVQVFVYTESVDMRKAIDGLSILLSETMDCELQSGDVFIFHNRARDKVKALLWHKNGFILHYKRLERGKFKFPKDIDGISYIITTEQLSWLFAGLEFMLMNEFDDLNFENYF